MQEKNGTGVWAVYLLVAGLCVGLGGCDRTEKMREVIDQRASEAERGLDAASKPTSPVAYDPLTVTNKVWSGNSALRMHRGVPLPARYEGLRGVTLVSSEPMSLSDVATAISAQTGIPVRLTALTIPSSSKSGSAAASATSPAFGPESQMPVSYEGPLSGLLDRLSAHFSISWRFDGSAVSISRYETRIFVVEALPGTQEINEGIEDDATVNDTSGGSYSSGSNSQAENTMTQNAKTTMSFKYWEELATVLNAIVGGQGSAIVSPTMGTVTVTTTPDVMATVSDYLAKENKRLSRQIAINVQIYSVSLSKSEDFSIAFSGFLKNLSSFSGMTYTSASVPGIANTNITSSDAFGALSIALLNGENDPTVHAGDVFRALSTIGDTTAVAQFPMMTLNNHPVSRRVGTDTSYIQSVTQNTTSSTSTTTILTPEISTVHDGFTLQLTPRLLDDGRILMQYSLSLIGLDTLGQTTFGPDELELSLPVTNNRLFVQQCMLRSGQTLVIGGVDREEYVQNRQGVGSPDNFLLGGGTSSAGSRLMLFMAITPQVMDVGQDGERR